jgi:DNA-binding transcriptional activator of the SARP family
MSEPSTSETSDPLANPGTEPWQISFFGNLSAKGGLMATRGELTLFLDDFVSRQHFALLALLAFEPGRQWNRDELSHLVWPETNAKYSLRTGLSDIRRKLSRGTSDISAHDVIISSRVGVALNPDLVRVDLDRFDRELSKAKFARKHGEREVSLTALRIAAEMYSPEVLAEFEQLPLRTKREELRRTIREVLKTLTEEYAQDNMEEAIRFARQAVLCEESDGVLASDERIRLIKLLKDGGRRTDYQREKDALYKMSGEERESVRDALDKACATDVPRLPSQAVRLDREAWDSFPNDKHAGDFIGREAELTELKALLFGRQCTDIDLTQARRATPFHRRLVTLTGLGGSGKTRLAQRLMDEVQRDSGVITVFVSLAGGMSVDDIARSVGEGLGIKSAGGDPILTVAAKLGNQPALIALDGAEHLAK